MWDLIRSPEAWTSLAFLSMMEIVLGVDNIVVITILCGRLPQEKQARARRLGLGFALITRVLLLLTLSFFAGKDADLFQALGLGWSVRDLIFLAGGLFLLYKGIGELRELEHADTDGDGDFDERPAVTGTSNMVSIIVQIMFMDIVFSLDSVISAVAMAQDVPVMVAAILIAVLVMMTFVGPVGDFIQKNPSVTVLALCSVVLIGGVLLMEAFDQEIHKSTVYAMLGFGFAVQLTDLRRQRQLAKRAAEAVAAQAEAEGTV